MLGTFPPGGAGRAGSALRRTVASGFRAAARARWERGREWEGGAGAGMGGGRGGGPGALKGRRCLRGAGLGALGIPVPVPRGFRARASEAVSGFPHSQVPGNAEHGDPGWQSDAARFGGRK